MNDYCDVPDRLLSPLRTICGALPSVEEQTAWTGSPRWQVRRRTFAHVLTLEVGATSALVPETMGVVDAPTTIVTFRSAGPELAVLRELGPPFFFVGWGRDAMALVLDDDTDWDEVAELVTESYCLLAPASLVALVDRPDDPDGPPDP